MFRQYETPVGVLRAESREGALVSLTLASPSDGSAISAFSPDPALNLLADELDGYFRGTLRRFTVPIRLCGTPFQNAVWQALADIPWGEVRTYGEIALLIGRPGAARAVGHACHVNPILLVIPCHRVVSAAGIGGFGLGLDIKRVLLGLEGR